MLCYHSERRPVGCEAVWKQRQAAPTAVSDGKAAGFSGVPTAKSGGVFPALTEKKAAAGQKSLRKRRTSAQRQFGENILGPVRPIGMRTGLFFCREGKSKQGF